MLTSQQVRQLRGEGQWIQVATGEERESWVAA